MRGRPRLAMIARFHDELRLWQAVEQTRSARFECPTPGAAINFVLRLNKCRAEARAEKGGEMIHVWDSFVVRRYENVILIEEKKAMDFSKLTDKQGAPMEVPVYPSPPNTPPIFQPQPIRSIPHEFDHSKPFGLDIADDKG